MSSERDKLPSRSSQGDVEAFLARVARTPPATVAGPRGRLLFAMDATASREPTWDQACRIQGEMFEATGSLGGLDVQLCYYRGFHDFHAGTWHRDTAGLLGEMTGVRCAAGTTQIGRVLQHALRESTAAAAVNALVFVGDCMEESIDSLCDQAGQLGLRRVPVFVFHEGHDAGAERAFRELARLSGGAYVRFDATSADQLRELLGAVAVYAAGGRKALAHLGKERGGAALALTRQLAPKGR